MTNQPESRPEANEADNPPNWENDLLRRDVADLRERLRDVEAERDQLAGLLYVLRWDLHVAYGSTARRGRGIGGQQVTTQCNVLDPEVWEVRALNAVDEALDRRGDDRTGRSLGEVIAELRVAFVDPAKTSDQHEVRIAEGSEPGE